ncbi:MAG: endonuclease/exonuclease/phosphatase family protein [Methylotenera sp.]|uniref:endonuclease/exonuclease/phosphatase family protein n=1 Tax=Methylotenera sp. TaxID=2051956 RepID=UPI0024885174|nr:endonuclease/exonuclease/phosphatase family protein [Methylotenera sp.]MDI1308847.1 endonuclease/exonuclease/phosphatase family protein [Methylotenera sp.]
MTMNIHGGRSNRGLRNIAGVKKLMDDFDVNIAVLQEVETRISRGGCNDELTALGGKERPYHLIAPSIIEHDGWYGNLIVSQYPIIRGIVHNLETIPQYEPRNAVDALIETPLGKLRIIGTHLSLSIFERRSEARNLIRLMNLVEETERNPIILMGDINEWQIPSLLLRFLNSHLNPLSCRATFPTWLPFLKLDRVWYCSDYLKVSAKTVRNGEVKKLSDHLPIVVTITN